MNNSNKKTQKKSISKSLKICYTIMNKTGNKNNKKKRFQEGEKVIYQNSVFDQIK